MRIKNQYSAESSPTLISALEKYKIPYKTITTFDPPLIKFTLYSDDSRRADIETELSSWHMIIPELVFTKAEYEKANWFRFMPKYDKVSPSDDEQTYSYFCKKADGAVDYDSTHKSQIGRFRLSKTPRWMGEKCILSAEGNYAHEWFTNDTTRQLMDGAGLCGFTFDSVLNVRDGVPLYNVYQIVFENALPEDAIVLGKEHGINSIVPCESCGEKRFYVCPQTYQLCLYDKYLGEQDVYMTQAVFGQGYGYHIVVGSKRFYNFIKENGLDKYFRIHPVKVIESKEQDI